MTKNIKPGDKAPAFSGETSDGKISLKDFKEENLVLYFYPKDDTPGCTIEAKDFRDLMPQFKRQKTKIIGISKDSIKSHCKFTDKYELSFPLISDEDGKICESFGVWIEKSMYGRKYMGIERATFLIGPEGKILESWRNVKASGHAEEVLNFIKNQKDKKIS